MKSRFFLFMSISALMLFTVGCSNDGEGLIEPSSTGTPGMLEIKLVGNTEGMTRAAVEGDLLDNEKLINDYTVFIFNESSNLLEKKQQQTGDGIARIENLSTGTSKKVVVLTNLPAGFPVINEGDPYSTLENAALELPSHSFDEIQNELAGMIMYGETVGVVISATSVNEATVNVSRLAAKITLSSLLINPNPGLDPTLFKITGISVQRAVNSVFAHGKTPGGAEIAGGFTTSTSTKQYGFLLDEVDFSFPTADAQPMSVPHAFYVFPNTGAGVDVNNCTLLTLEAQYANGAPFYYPIPINAVVKNDQDSTFIKSNHNYIVQITLKDIANGSTTPEELLERAALDVEIVIKDWTDINQIEEW